MNCEESQILLSGYLDQQNTDEEMALLRAHLEECPACRKVLAALEEIDRGIAGLEEQPPAELKTSVMDAIRKEAKQKRSLRRWMPLAAAAALALMIGVGGIQNRLAMDTAAPMAVTADLQAPMRMARAVEQVSAEETLLSQSVADRLGACVTETRELLPEMEVCPCETLEDGSLLYRLDTQDGAEMLSRQYDLPLYVPVEKASEVSYARLIS